MKKNKIIFWVATVFIFLFEGVMPVSALIFAPSSATAGTVYLGYPIYFAYMLIAFKALGAIALIITKLPRPIKEWAYAGLAFNFVAACISHFAVDGASGVSFFPLIILTILIVSYIYYFKTYHHGKNGL
ncbi:DoxX family protein [Chitinophaga niabensis]|uniref:DoxX-like family protein n=1 Tax=Chitinophaga niabensis TaxID=536979 RepID=A0A1N6KAN9_9BACT|nr:DoxX family protein [Chitinophaga niabensis]SIO53397.1 DoxX-like family protein [Chitinophaga niabensis]